MVSIVSRAAWGFSGWRNTPGALNRSSVGYVTYHYDGDAPCQNQTGAGMMRNIHSFHKNGRGWSGIGYNFVIDSNGTIFEGRGLAYRGAHKPSGPGNNATGIGIQLHCGGNEEPTEAMKASAVALRRWCEGQLGKSLKVSWHNQGYSTSCPGPKVRAWIDRGMPVKGGAAPKPASKPVAAVVKLSKAVIDAAKKLQATVKNEPRGPFALPAGHAYAQNDGTNRTHSGLQAKDKGAVMMIQRKVGVTADGDYGKNTANAVSAWQRKIGLPSTGEVNETLWRLM